MPDCGCRVMRGTNRGTVHILHCPLHAAAPHLYELLKDVTRIYEGMKKCGCIPKCKKDSPRKCFSCEIRAALAGIPLDTEKAKG